ncbi:uncharacterized protein LOC124125465 isoform X3 [Haliotis rufescens]|uniref:uncharacterized protein LOC124125465 isoform X3 n=1 Tax=Haliotis rufescens TaxID=6454 RepID=UPI00201EC8F0|nr:uncharacterized protein LOC124125465 isoform X3 [Haliotis rufescens]
MFPQLNVCCVLTGLYVSVCLSSILASPSCQNCLFGKCDQDGVCTDGCEPGFVDIFCQHPCQETCTNGRCMMDNRTGTTMCTEGCVDGFCFPACKIPCPEGCLRCKRMLCENCTLCESHLYGENCQHSCLDKCKGYACSIQGYCSQDTCMGGRYGKLCSSSCKPRYESCDQVSGHCLKCRRGLFGDDCQYHCSQCLTREEEDMFRCRSGCKLCVKPLQPESKKELDYTDMEAKFNIMYGLCIALIVITLTILCFHIKNAWQWRCGRRENVEDIRKKERTMSEQTNRKRVRTMSEQTNRSYARDSGTPLLEMQEEVSDQPPQQIPGTPLLEGHEEVSDQPPQQIPDDALSDVHDGSDRSSQKSEVFGTPLLEELEEISDQPSQQIPGTPLLVELDEISGKPSQQIPGTDGEQPSE